MKGSMRERRAGVWELIVQLPRDSTASRSRQLSRTVHGTKREAQRALAALVTEVSAGKVNASNTTVAALLERWLDQVGEQLSPTTVREYRRLVAKRIGPDLGKLARRQVTAQRLDAYYVALGRDHALSPATIRHIHAVLRGSLGQAVRWGWIPANPAASASPPEAAPGRDLSARDRCDAGDHLGCERARPGLRGAATGPRRNRHASRRGLRAAVVRSDRHAGTLAVQRAVVSVQGGTVIKDTKTHADRRIAVDQDTLAALDAHRERQERLAAACRVDLGPEAYIFSTQPDGSQPLHPDTVTGGFRRICERLGLKGVRLHDLRHLHATQLVAAGVPVRAVSGRLGHANAATTLNVYAAFVEASDRNAASVIGGLLTPNTDGSAAPDHTGGGSAQ